MDAIDRQLLDLLSANARLPLKTLAAHVGLARSSVRERLARLESSGVIRRYTIELAPAAPQIRALLKVKLVQTPMPTVVRAICARPEVHRCRSLSGAIDLLVELTGPDIAGINAARDAIALLPGVAAVDTTFVLKHDKGTA
jgi:DNA-binding Lrp family transcriptional regulator